MSHVYGTKKGCRPSLFKSNINQCTPLLFVSKIRSCRPEPDPLPSIILYNGSVTYNGAVTYGA